MGKFRKVIFIDADNTAFSPLAGEMLQRQLSACGIYSIDVDSRGVVVLFPEPVNPKVSAAAEKKNIDLSDYRAKAVAAGDFSEFTLSLAIDVESKRRTYAKFPSAMNLYTLKEYLGESGDIRVPTGGTVEEYIAAVDNLSKLISRLAKKLTED